MQIVFGLLFLLFFSACCLCVAACTRFDAALLPLPALCGSAVVLYLLSLLGLLQFGHLSSWRSGWPAGLLWGACRVAGYPAGAVQPRLFAVCGRQLLFVGAVCFAAAHVYPVG